MKYHGIIGSLFFTAVLASSCANNQSAEFAEKSVEQKKAEIYYSQGTNDLVKKNYSQALVNLLKAKEFDSKDSLIRNNLGMAYYFREQPDLAEKELKEAISLDAKNTDAKANLGTIYMERNRIKEARELFNQAAQDLTYSNQFRNYYNLAMLALKEGDRAEAYEFLFKSTKEKDDYCQAHFKLGELYTEEYKFKQALDAFRESSKGTCVNEPIPHYQQALVLINLGRYEEARTKLKLVIEKFPKTKFVTLSNQQLRRLSNEIKEQSANSKTYQTEIIKESQTIESPNF